MDLEFTHKKSYGQDRFYPRNGNAEFLLRLMKIKTVQIDSLREMKEFGWNVKITYEPFEL